MRITRDDAKTIFNTYYNLREDVNLGAGIPKNLGVTSIGVQGPKIPRAPIAALKGEVPAATTVGPEEAEESPLPMALTNLDSLIDCASQLKSLFETESELEPWAAEKVSLAADYMQSVLDSIKFKHEGGFEHQVN